MPKKSQETFSFPRGPLPMGVAVEEAMRAMKAEYDGDVAAIADDCAPRIDAGELADPRRCSAWLGEAVAKSRRVTDGKRALRGLLVSESADIGDIQDVAEDMAFAMTNDVLNALEERGYDVEDIDVEDPREDDGDEDEEDAA